MGFACVIALWSLLGLVAAPTAMIGAFVLISGIRQQHTLRIVIGALLGSGGALIAAIAVVFIAGWFIFGLRPTYSASRDVFRDEFGFDAPSDVTAIESEARGSTDSAMRFMRFRSSPATIQRVVSTRFKAVPYTDCERRFKSERERPSWWQPAPSSTSVCYAARPFDDAFKGNEAWMAYDASSGYAHYFYVGVD